MKALIILLCVVLSGPLLAQYDPLKQSQQIQQKYQQQQNQQYIRDFQYQVQRRPSTVVVRPTHRVRKSTTVSGVNIHQHSSGTSVMCYQVSGVTICS